MAPLEHHIRGRGRRVRLVTVGAIALYACLYVIWSWPLAAHFSTHVVLPPAPPGERGEKIQTIRANDQLLTISGIARNAHALLGGEVGALVDHGLCFPTPNAAFLGEHMIESSLLALPFYAATGDPIAAYNGVSLLSVLIAGTGMFLLVKRFTASIGAAFVAGLAFAFFPGRLGNLLHLAVSGTHWIPLVLLAFERVLHDARLRDTTSLIAVACLACLTGAYPLMMLALFGLPYGAIRLIQCRALIDVRRVMLLAAAIAVVLAVVSVVLAPYLTELRAWGIQSRGSVISAVYAYLWPGGLYPLGGTALVLALFAGLPARQVEAGPAVAVVAGTVACLLFAAEGPLWRGGPPVPSVYEMLRATVPLVGFVRAPLALVQGAATGLAILTGLGCGKLVQRLPATAGNAIVVVAALLVVAETTYEPVRKTVYPRRLHAVVTQRIAPDPEVLAVYEALDERGLEGPVMDLPYAARPAGPESETPAYVFLSGYHLRPTTACYNSFAPPTFLQLGNLAARLPSDRAVVELAAAGIPNLVVHHEGHESGEARESGDGHEGRSSHRYEELGRLADVETVAGSPRATAYRITADPPTHGDAGRLQVLGVELPPFVAKYQWFPRLYVLVRNASERTWTIPRPIEPMKARLEIWEKDGAEPVLSLERTLLLPLATAPGQTDRAVLKLPKRLAPGRYVVNLEVPELGWRLSPHDELHMY